MLFIELINGWTFEKGQYQSMVFLLGAPPCPRFSAQFLEKLCQDGAILETRHLAGMVHSVVSGQQQPHSAEGKQPLLSWQQE